MQSLSHISKTPGIGGTLKNEPEDFRVEEITKEGVVLEIDKKITKTEINETEAKFTHFVLQKRDWSTSNAIREIAKKLHVSQTRFNAAGMKDKNAITAQLVSAFAVSPERLLQLKIRDIFINGAWASEDKIRIGDLLGNRFTIRATGIKENVEGTVCAIYEETNGIFPNYFGEQRFGTARKNTHLVGERILRNELEEAALLYLADSSNEENVEAKTAREELRKSMDFGSALRIFPKHLALERSMISHLASHPTDYANAFRRLPRNILLMFIHAFQSHLFNLALSKRIGDGELRIEEGEYSCGENFYGFPDINKKEENGQWPCMKIIGYESKINGQENEILEKSGITLQDFKVKSIPEISSKGTYRIAFAPLKDFSFSNDKFKFSLPSGSYATVALREFLDNKK